MHEQIAQLERKRDIKIYWCYVSKISYIHIIIIEERKYVPKKILYKTKILTTEKRKKIFKRMALNVEQTSNYIQNSFKHF